MSSDKLRCYMISLSEKQNPRPLFIKGLGIIMILYEIQFGGGGGS